MSDAIERGLEELFASPSEDDEAEEQRLIKAPVALDAIEGPPLGDVLALDPQGLQLTISRDEDDATLHLAAAVANLSPYGVELDQVSVVLRDARGALLDCAELSVGVSFRKAQEVLGDVELSLEALDTFDTIELWGVVNYDVTARVYEGVLDACDPGPRGRYRRAWPVEPLPVQPRPGEPELRVDLAAFFGYRYDSFAEVVFTLQDPTRQIESADCVVVLRDADGELIGKEQTWMRDLRGAPVAQKATLDLLRSLLRRVRKVEVALKGRVQRTERLGVFRRGAGASEGVQ